MRHARIGVLASATATLLGIGMVFGPPAVAAPITIGQLPSSTPATACSGGPVDLFQASVASGSTYVVPAGYTTLTSWSTYAGASTGETLKLKVYRLVTGTTYLVVGHDGPRTLTASTVNTFAVHIPVQAGDIVGLNDQNAPAVNNACLVATGNAGDIYRGSGTMGDAADGSTESIATSALGYKLNVLATLAAAPGVTSLTPTTGSVVGGTSVVIGGHDFTGATAVSFGGTPASHFTVNSDTQITATAPAHASPGAVDVTVTTPYGQSTTSASDRFTYTACVVPNVKHKKLKKAKAALKQAGCALGKVKHKKHHKHGKVKSESPKIGTVLPPGSKVSIKLT